MLLFASPSSRRSARRSVVLVLSSIVLTSSPVLAQMQRVSVSSSGLEANGLTGEASFSADGRFVVFTSSATNLTGDARGGTFLRDRQLGLTTWIDDTPPTGYRPSISEDGNRIVFFRAATGWFVRDRSTGLSTPLEPVPNIVGQPDAITSPVISANGQHVAFYSDRRTDGSFRGVYVRNLATAAVCVAHRSTVGEAGDGPLAGGPTISADGRKVSFVSAAPNLVAADFNQTDDAFVHDCSTGVTIRATPAVVPATSGVNARAVDAALSGNGERMIVTSDSGSAFSYSRWEVFQTASGLSAGAFEEWSLTGQLLYKLLNPRLSHDGRIMVGIMVALSRYGQSDWVVRHDIGTIVPPAPTSPLVLAEASSVTRVHRDVTLSADGQEVLIVSANPFLVSGDGNNLFDAFVFARDGDGDGMSSIWELGFGLDPSAPDGALDSDGDGVTNAQEFAAGTHPRGVASATRRFAEGAATSLFSTQFAIANPDSTTAAQVLLKYAPEGRAPQSVFVLVQPGDSRTISPGMLPAINGAEFSTTVESNVPVVVDRRMVWPEGSHVETGLAEPSATWHFAEGATSGGFDLFYLFQNAGSAPSTVRVRYLTPTGPPVERTYTVAPSSRFTVWVDLISQLANTEVAAEVQVTAGPAIVAERAQYLSRPGRSFVAGHESAGVTAPANEWLFAEGATGPFFDLFVLLSNPASTAAQVEATFLLPDGTSRQQVYSVAGLSRFNLWVDELTFGGVKALADTAVSVRLRSLNGIPIVAERSMWWPGGANAWEESHNSPGATSAGLTWALADGEVGGAAQHETYVLIANPGSTPATVDVRLLPNRGEGTRRYTVAPTSRFNVAVGSEFPSSSGFRFGVLVRSVGPTPAPIVVERAVYSSAGGVAWGAGAAALAARLP